MQTLIHGYVDGELDLVRSLEIERHLQECPACTRAYQQQQTLHHALSAGSLYYPAPEGLRKRLQEAGRKAGPATPAFPSRVRPWMAAAASLLLVAGLAGVLFYAWPAHNEKDLVAREVVAAHVRSLMAPQSADVLSSDQHTVKPWFNGKLDFSPPVVNEADQGFPLVGGRLDYVADRPVAALVYKRAQHVINLLIWPAGGKSEESPVREMRQGYNLYHWTQAGMIFWAISDLNPRELGEFVQLIRQPLREQGIGNRE
ncbi:MAG: anti-sigma factor [Planctomycetes bacterium]|nr:anti-sigma factor [Planctomycetota bacterium]